MNPTYSDKTTDSQQLINQIVLEFMREKRRKRIRRWGMRIFYILLLLFLYFKFVGFSDNDDAGDGKKPHAGLIELKGTIFDTQSANAEYFAKGMEDAYKKTGLKALILRINSPGGSPVQADYMYNTIMHYRKKYPDIKVYAVCVDLCASAAYYVAAAADEIYANESSMVGSIGVLFNGFGFVDAMQKVGVTRRLRTAGANKGFLDPFSPTNPAQELFLQGLLDKVHQQFIEKVKAGRKDRLKIDNNTFSGLIWIGIQAKEQGLIDGFGSSGDILRDVIKLDNVIDYSYKENMFTQVSKSIGSAVLDILPQALGLSPSIKAEL